LENKITMKQSYSAKVKEELLNVYPNSRHCKIAEIAGLFSVDGEVANNSRLWSSCKFQGEERVCNKYFTLLKKTNILGEYDSVKGLLDGSVADNLLEMIKYKPTLHFAIDESLLKRPCCRSAYLRGVFLAAGSITDPMKAYHLEIVARSYEQAKQIISVMATFSINAKLSSRLDKKIIYIKEIKNTSIFSFCNKILICLCKYIIDDKTHFTSMI